MNLDLLLDPLFRTPFIVGLLMSAVLPLIGNLLRLRDEWLAALGLAYLAGASGLVGLAFGIPVVLGAPLGALCGAIVKAFGNFRGNSVYAMMVVIGWATTMMVASNTPLGSAIGHELIEGQLYFAGTLHLASAVVTAVLCIAALPFIIPPLVRARLLPGHEISNHLPSWRWHLGFDGLAAISMAVGAGTVGLMAAFALAFVPPWAAFRIARNWRHCQWISAGIGVGAYCLSFALALAFDQPFAPMLVTILLLATGSVVLIRSY